MTRRVGNGDGVPTHRVQLAVVGEFAPHFPPHVATKEGIEHAARGSGVAADVEWVPARLPHSRIAKRR